MDKWGGAESNLGKEKNMWNLKHTCSTNWEDYGMNWNVKHIQEKQRWKMKGRLQRSVDKYQKSFERTKEKAISVRESRTLKEM